MEEKVFEEGKGLRRGNGLGEVFEAKGNGAVS